MNYKDDKNHRLLICNCKSKAIFREHTSIKLIVRSRIEGGVRDMGNL